MKTLVTGGAGFVGSHLVDELLARGHSVSVLDDFSTGLRENLPTGLQIHEADLRSNRTREIVLSERPDVIFHLAAQMNVRRSVSDPAQDADVNILGSLRLFQAAAESGTRRIIFASSGGTIYGEFPGRPSLESDLPRPASPYGIAKLSAEHYGRYFAGKTDSEFISLRLANVFGPRQNPRGEAGIVALFLEAMLEERAPIIFGDGNQTRDFIWVGDVVSAFMAAIEGPAGTYNVGTGIETSVNAICERLAEITGFEGEASRLPPALGELRRNVLCPKLAREALSWCPRVEFSRSLQATAEFFRNAVLKCQKC